MKFLSVKQYAEMCGASERTVRNYCATGKLHGAFLTGKTWNIPADAKLSHRRKVMISPLLSRLRDEKESNMKGGIYHYTQVALTYNSNHMEGSRLTEEQTRYIFETNTLGITTESTGIDDIIETVNHFRCIDYVIDHATEVITEAHIKQLHYLLKSNTSDRRKSWFAIGDYKRLPNEVGGAETTPPIDVHSRVKQLLTRFNHIKRASFTDILDFHVQFERIHPFQDGNGRVGRLLILWQCLHSGVVPFIITEALRFYYYRGLSNWDTINGYLTDTCLTAQDEYKQRLTCFQIQYRFPTFRRL